MEKALPAIPAKRYFTIGEVSELCGVKPYVLRYWEQEFTQLKPMKRRGNRRYYQHHEVLLVRRIRELLYDQGFTISGARNRLSDGLGAAPLPSAPLPSAPLPVAPAPAPAVAVAAAKTPGPAVASVALPVELDAATASSSGEPAHPDLKGMDSAGLRVELLSIRDLLSI
jgi:MerR HTH family regulatory protein